MTKTIPLPLVMIGQRIAPGNISYTLAQIQAERFALIVRDEDANELITRFNGPENIIRARYESMATKAGAK